MKKHGKIIRPQQSGGNPSPLALEVSYLDLAVSPPLPVKGHRLQKAGISDLNPQIKAVFVCG